MTTKPAVPDPEQQAPVGVIAALEKASNQCWRGRSTHDPNERYNRLATAHAEIDRALALLYSAEKKDGET